MKKTMITFRVTPKEETLLADLMEITGKDRSGTILQAIRFLWYSEYIKKNSIKPENTP